MYVRVEAPGGGLEMREGLHLFHEARIFLVWTGHGVDKEYCLENPPLPHLHYSKTMSMISGTFLCVCACTCVCQTKAKPQHDSGSSYRQMTQTHMENGASQKVSSPAPISPRAYWSYSHLLGRVHNSDPAYSDHGSKE